MSREDEIRCMCDDTNDIPVVEVLYLLGKIDKLKAALDELLKAFMECRFDYEFKDYMREIGIDKIKQALKESEK